MKITLNTSAGNGDGISRFPTLRIPYDECINPDGTPNRLKLIQALTTKDNSIVIGGGDDVVVLQAAATILEELNARCDTIAAMSKGAAWVQGEAEMANPKGAAEKRMNKGAVANCKMRLSYRSTTNDVCVRISYNHHTACGGNAYEYAKDLAILVAQVCFEVRDMFIQSKSPVKLTVADGEGCEGLCAVAVKDALWRIECKRIADLNEARLHCEHLHGWEWCKGCQTNCPNWGKGGKCVDIPKPEMPRITE